MTGNLLLLGLMLFGSGAFAFINVEAVRNIPGEGFAGNSSFQINGQEGNTQKFTSRASTLGVYRWTRDELLFLGEYLYGTSQNRKDTNRGQGHLRYTFLDREPLGYEVFVQSEFDEFKDLNSRNLAGANIRKRLIKNEQRLFYLGAGAFYEVEDFSLSPDHEGIRGNLYVSHSYKVTDLVTSGTTLYYQPLFKDLEEFRIRFQTGLNFHLSKTLSLSLDFSMVHDTALPDDVKATDIDYLVGFAVAY